MVLRRMSWSVSIFTPVAYTSSFWSHSVAQHDRGNAHHRIIMLRKVSLPRPIFYVEPRVEYYNLLSNRILLPETRRWHFSLQYFAWLAYTQSNVFRGRWHVLFTLGLLPNILCSNFPLLHALQFLHNARFIIFSLQTYSCFAKAMRWESRLAILDSAAFLQAQRRSPTCFPQIREIMIMSVPSRWVNGRQFIRWYEFFVVQDHGGNYSFSSDVYSLGLVFARMHLHAATDYQVREVSNIRMCFINVWCFRL